MKKVVVSLVGAAALATITAGMAAGTHSTVASQDFFNNDAAGIYVSGNLGYGHYNDKTLSNKYRHGFAWNANAGYQFNQYVAIEAGYISYETHKIEIPSGSEDMNLSGIDLVAKGIMPINDQFSVFGKAGVMRLQTKVSSTAGAQTLAVYAHRYVPVLGLGASYNINKQVAFNVQGLYTTAAKATSSEPAVSQTFALLAGVSYKFSTI